MAAKAYTVCTVNKIKSLNSAGRYSARSAGEHNTRAYTPVNCDPDKQIDNKDIVCLPVDLKGNPMTYQKVIKNSIQKIQENKTMGTIRKDAVYGFELCLGFTPPDGKNWTDVLEPKDLDKWCNDNKNWIEKRFGKENLKHLVLHMDETNPHLHALIVPINEAGRLSAKSFIDGPKDCSKLQTEYANEVGKIYGFSRGVSKKNKHLSKKMQKELYPSYKTISDFKKNRFGKMILNEEDIKAKENEKDESGHMLPIYEERMIKDLQSVRFQAESYIQTIKQELKEEVKEADEALDVRYHELDLLQEELEKKEKVYKEHLKQLQQKEDEFTKSMKLYADSHKTMAELHDDFKFLDTLNRALKNHPDKEYSQKMYKEINKLVKEQHEWDKINKGKYMDYIK